MTGRKRAEESRTQKHHPPRLPRLLLSHFVHDERASDVLGDLEEHFRRRVDRDGKRRAHLWYWRQALAFLVTLLRERIGRSLARYGPQSPSQRAERQHSPRTGSQLKTFFDEIRHAVRKLARSPSFALISTGTLAVGIAANTAIFSLVYGVVLSPLPFPESERLMLVGHSAPGLGLPEIEQASGTHFIYKELNETFEDLAVAQRGSQTLTGSGEPERLQSARVSASFFDVMRVPPILGHPISAEDDIPGAAPVVLLSHGLWNRRFGSDPDVIGRNVDIGSVAHEVIGVMPAGFTYPGNGTDLWLPIKLDPNDGFGGFYLTGLGRLKSGVTVAQADADLKRLVATVADHFVDFTEGIIENAQLKAVVSPLKESIVGNIQRTLWILLGAVGFVLLIACANVANLFLVRAEARQREVAVRAALGAGRSALIRYFLTESATLTVCGGLLGLLLAWVGIRTLIGLAPEGIPRLEEVGINAPVLAFTAVTSVLSGLFFGSFPVVRHAAPDIASILKEGGRGTSAGRTRHRVRHLLVVAQIALALVLLVGSGLMVRSFQKLRGVEPGFDPGSVLTFRISLPDAEYPDALSAFQFHQEITDRIEQLPGVLTVGFANGLPLTGEGARDPLISEDHPVSADELPPIVHMNAVSPDYFRAMRIPLISGRALEISDARERTGAVLVSTALADHFWPNESPLGKRVYPGLIDDPKWYTVVGLVVDVRANSLRGENPEIIYLPTIGTNDAAWWSPHSMAYAVRTTVPPLSIASGVRAAVWEVNPNLPIAQMTTMKQIVADSTAQTAFAMLLIATAAAVALVLGTVGIYAVIAYVVGQRFGEIGIRIALGAQSFEVRRMVLMQGGIVALIGVAIGLVGAFGVTRLLSAMLFGVSATDPATYAAVALLLMVVALLASYLPARRAASVDPVTALRAD